MVDIAPIQEPAFDYLYWVSANESNIPGSHMTAKVSAHHECYACQVNNKRDALLSQLGG